MFHMEEIKKKSVQCRKIFETEELFFSSVSASLVSAVAALLQWRRAARPPPGPPLVLCDRQDWTNAYLVPCWTLALVGLAAPLLRAAAQERR